MIRENKNRQDAAVSETIGFILMFAIVVISMSFVYVMGYPVLQSNMDSSIFESSEQNFIVLQSNMKMVAFDHVPVKNMKMKLYSSSLATTNESQISIQYDTNIVHHYPGGIEYYKDDNLLLYENGAIFKRYHPRGEVMVSEPRIYSSTMNNVNITTIGLIMVDGNSGIGGSSIVNVNMQHNISSLIRTDDTVNVTLSMNSSFASLWKDYLEDIGFTTATYTDTTLTSYRNDTILIIGQHYIDVEIK